MNLKYLLKESLNGFQKAQLSVVASIFSIALALVLIGGYIIAQTNLNNLVSTLRNKVELEVFLNNSETEYKLIKTSIINIDGVSSAIFISKKEAADIFKKEFGEDINTVLEFNPLPASFRVTLEREFKESNKTAIIASKIKLISGVDDVVYRKKLLEFIDSRSKLLTSVSLGVGGMLLLVSFGFVVNTIRLAIAGKRKAIETMRLVGATNSFIRLPFIIEGIFQGIIGSTVALGIIILCFYIFSKFISSEISNIIFLPTTFVTLILGLGIFLGWFGSYFGVRRFLK